MTLSPQLDKLAVFKNRLDSLVLVRDLLLPEVDRSVIMQIEEKITETKESIERLMRKGR